MHSKDLQDAEQLSFFSESSQSAPDGDAVSFQQRKVASAEPVADHANPSRSKSRNEPKSAVLAKTPRAAELAKPRKQLPKLFLKDSEVAERYSISRPTVWRWAKSRPGFPQPIPLAEGTTRWAIADLEAFERSLKAEVQTGSVGGAV
ncbi:helix-turn-helix transcriptional regulator [Salipiger sp.]|uniref:helix-turn-helix transcriptional regulator n=1 Tax=Salipiger sp. TaxID=2078585 RepID=UPI003A96BF2C